MAEWNDKCVLGGPRYQVGMNGQHSRQVHIDHLQQGIHKDIVTLADQLIDITDTNEPGSSPAPTDTLVDLTSITMTTEPLRRSTRLVMPTRRLILKKQTELIY